jgi:hypothetical protein
LIEHRDPGALADGSGNPLAGVINGLGSHSARRKSTTDQGPIVGQAEVIRAIVIESRTAQAINPPRQPHRAVLVTEYAGETVIRLHAHQDVDRGHGESLNDHTMFDELEATLSPSGQRTVDLGASASYWDAAGQAARSWPDLNRRLHIR